MRLVLENHLPEPAAEKLAVVPDEEPLQIIGADHREIAIANLGRLGQRGLVDPLHAILDLPGRVEEGKQLGLPLDIRPGVEIESRILHGASCQIDRMYLVEKTQRWASPIRQNAFTRLFSTAGGL